MVDFSRACEIARSVELEDHHEDCSFRTTEGGVLCDCDVLHKHPDMLEKN